MKKEILNKKQIIKLSSKARNKELSIADLEFCINEVKKDDSLFNRVSILRLCKRLEKSAEIKFTMINRLLSQCYKEAGDTTYHAKEKFRYYSWAIRYGNTKINSKIYQKLLYNSIKSAKSQKNKIEILTCLDGNYQIDYKNNNISLSNNEEWKFEPLVETENVLLSPINRLQYSADYSHNNIFFSALTNTGTKKFNNDNILFSSFNNGSIIAAICDGCGSSADANIVSNIVLKSFLFAYQNSLDIPLAITFASASARNHNLLNKINGETTFVFLNILDNKYCMYGSFGDSFVIIEDILGEFHTTKFKPIQSRVTMGCEPLGTTITSSGNVNNNLVDIKQANVYSKKKIKMCLLGCDGVLTNADHNFEYFINLLKNQDTKNIVNLINERTIEAFENGTKADNISLIYGKLV